MAHLIPSHARIFSPTASNNRIVQPAEAVAASCFSPPVPLSDESQSAERLPLPVGMGKGTALAEGISPLARNYWQPMQNKSTENPVELEGEILVYDDAVINAITTDPALEAKIHARLQAIDDSLMETIKRPDLSDAVRTETLIALKEESESLTGKIEKILCLQTYPINEF
jgi:hypothetical protein